MDIQLAQKIIKKQVSEVNEEWMLRALLRFLGIDDRAADDDFVKQYEAKLKPMTKEEMIKRSEKSLQSFREGNYIEIEKYLEEIKDLK